MIDPFVGAWELDPSTLAYEHGRPGKRAVYVVEALADGLVFRLEYDDADGKPAQVEYGGPLDGSEQPLAGAPGLALVLLRDGPRSIESRLLRDGAVIDRWTREISADGERMEVTQHVAKPGGGVLLNRSTYRRLHGERG